MNLMLPPYTPRAVLNLPGQVGPTGWTIPDDLAEDEWVAAGLVLGKAERSLQWWIGDWWIFGQWKYGERRAIVEAETWEGPQFESCKRAGVVARAFGERDRRRSLLTFAHHIEVASIEDTRLVDELLDYAEQYQWSSKKLRSEVSKRRNRYGNIPSTESESVDDLQNLIDQGKTFGCIYADPPWLYDNQATRAATGNHYEGMTVDEMASAPFADQVRRLAAPDAHLHMWTTNAFLFSAPRLFDAWGFEFRSSFVWCKPQMGIGNYWRNSHEFLLTAIRGNAKGFNDRSLNSWAVLDRGKHSVKPEQIRPMIEKASPGPFIELFSRREVEGWTVWGNEVQQNRGFI